MEPASFFADLAERDRPLAAVIACAARQPDQSQVAAALCRALDWSAFIQAAEAHRLTGAISRTVARADLGVPERVRAHVRERCGGIAASNLLLCALLENTLVQLGRHGVPVLSFRGPVLAADTWGGLSMRESGDVDVLVPRTSLSTARQALCESGYRLQDREARLLDGPFPWVEHHFVFHDAATPAAVELHTAVSSWCFSLPIETGPLFDRSRAVTLAGMNVRTFSAEDQLLELAIHGTKHQWGRVRYVCDLAETIHAHPNLDWDVLVDRARAPGGLRMLLGGLSLAHRWLGAEVPRKILALIAADAWAAELPFRLARNLTGCQRPASGWSQVRLHAASRERVRDRGRYLTRGVAEALILLGTLEVLPRLARLRSSGSILAGPGGGVVW